MSDAGYVSSYPYLNASRRLGVPYGVVLLYADMLEGKHPADRIPAWTSPHMGSPNFGTEPWALAVTDVWQREHARRKALLA